MFDCNTCGVTKQVAEYRHRKNGYRIPQCRDCERQYQREWTKREPEKYRARKRESMAKRRAENPEKARTYRNSYHHKNREHQTKKMRDYYARRFFWAKSMKLRGVDRATFRELAALWKKQRGRCALTGRKLDRTAHLDHIQAKARGGRDHLDNLRWVDPFVNLAKRDMSDDEWVALCGDVMRWIGERIQMVDAIPSAGHERQVPRH